MKRGFVLVATVALLGALAIGAVACGDDNNGEATPTEAEMVPTLEPTATPEGAMTPAPGDESAQITLSEEGTSGVTGSATLTASEGTTEVLVTIDGGLEERSYLLHVHVGTCEQQGEFVQALPDLAGSASGVAEGTGTVNQALDTLTDGQHYLIVFDQNTPLACGNIEAPS